MYQPEWINRLEQYGYITYELLIEDDDGILPPAKQEFKFFNEPSVEQMTEISNKFITQTLENLNPPEE